MDLEHLPPIPPAYMSENAWGVTAHLPAWTPSVRDHQAAHEAFQRVTAHMSQLVQMDLIRALRAFWDDTPTARSLSLDWEVGSANNYFDLRVSIDSKPFNTRAMEDARGTLRDSCEQVPPIKAILVDLVEDMEKTPFRGTFTRAQHRARLNQWEAQLLQRILPPALALQREAVLAERPAAGRPRQRA